MEGDIGVVFHNIYNQTNEKIAFLCFFQIIYITAKVERQYENNLCKQFATKSLKRNSTLKIRLNETVDSGKSYEEVV